MCIQIRRDQRLDCRCINFIDARTKWFDAAVRDAVNGGTIKQVCWNACAFSFVGETLIRFAHPISAAFILAEAQSLQCSAYF